MKSVGIIRKIDDLGRIVIPKDIRKSIRINDFDNIEIKVVNDSIILKKFSYLDNNLNIIQMLVDIFSKVFHTSILITDNERVLAISRNNKIGINNELSISIIEAIKNRKNGSLKTNIITNGSIEDIYIFPVVSNGDVFGSIIINNSSINNEIIASIRLISEILIKIVEV